MVRIEPGVSVVHIFSSGGARDALRWFSYVRRERDVIRTCVLARVLDSVTLSNMESCLLAMGPIGAGAYPDFAFHGACASQRRIR